MTTEIKNQDLSAAIQKLESIHNASEQPWVRSIALEAIEQAKLASSDEVAVAGIEEIITDIHQSACRRVQTMISNFD